MRKRKISLRFSRTLAALGLVGACTVVDKADYTFDDSPDDSGGEGGTGGTGGTGGKGGRGGSAGSSSGTAGTSTASGGEGATAGGEGGEAGTSGSGGTGGKGGSGGKGGTGGSDPCDPDPCVNGDCSPAGSGYFCDCNPGWEGDECDVVVDGCDPNPCQHGGTCVVDGDGFRCTCVDGYTGVICEGGGPCDPNPCQGNGTCTVIRSTFSCACRSGLTGTTCQSFGPTCRDMRSGGVATSDGVYEIDPNGGDDIDDFPVYCDMTGGGITYEEVAFGAYTGSYPGYDLLTIADLQDPRVQEAFIWSYNRQGGMRNLNLGGTDGNCCFKAAGTTGFLNIGSGPVFPAGSTTGYDCNGPYDDPIMQMYMYYNGIIATAPLPPNFFQLYPVGANYQCSDGDNPAIFFERY
jgi:hypothetical protein